MVKSKRILVSHGDTIEIAKADDSPSEHVALYTSDNPVWLTNHQRRELATELLRGLPAEVMAEL